jgi:hypothetical protein
MRRRKSLFKLRHRVRDFILFLVLRSQNVWTTMSKTLSTGTLSLRFMQNASRAKQLKEVELEKAAVKDDAEWEIANAKEVRESWRLSGTTAATAELT